MTWINRTRWATSYFRRHHVALFALFFALGGTSFAAANALLPANSVGTAGVNGSLQTTDLSKTARTALKGKPGSKGPSRGTGRRRGARTPPGRRAISPFSADRARGRSSKDRGVAPVRVRVRGVDHRRDSQTPSPSRLTRKETRT